MAEVPSTKLYCRVCRYRLDPSVVPPRCPECGAAFDPADPATHLGTAHGGRRPIDHVLASPVFWVGALAALIGVLDVYALPPGLRDRLLVVLLAGSALAWCVFDARRRGRPLRPGYAMLIVACAPIAFPVYLLVTRRRNAGVWIVGAVGVGVLGFVLMHGGVALGNVMGL